MKLVVNPEFHALNDFVKRLPGCFEREGKTIYKERNELKIFEEGGFLLNVKSYRKPVFANQVVYTFFRKSKARRAYENALEVLTQGFDTPKPVAYIEGKKGGLLNKSYFVCLQCPYTRMFREFANYSDISGREDIPQALAQYVAKMHQAGILHLDFSIGNILFEKTEAGIHFSLVDLNRMAFQPVDQKTGCRNFERLRGNGEFFRILAETYAKARGFDAESCLKMMLHYNAKSVKRFTRKSKLKRRFCRDR